MFSITAPYSGDDDFEFRQDFGYPEWEFPCSSSTHSNTYLDDTVWEKWEGVGISDVLISCHILYLEENKTIKIMCLKIFRFVYLYQEVAILWMDMFWIYHEWESGVFCHISNFSDSPDYHNFDSRYAIVILSAKAMVL